MTFAFRHPPAQADVKRVSWLTVFDVRCAARAMLVEACAMTLIEAVDGLQKAAVDTGLVMEIGQDAVQEIMAHYFGELRGTMLAR